MLSSFSLPWLMNLCVCMCCSVLNTMSFVNSPQFLDVWKPCLHLLLIAKHIEFRQFAAVSWLVKLCVCICCSVLRTMRFVSSTVTDRPVLSSATLAKNNGRTASLTRGIPLLWDQCKFSHWIFFYSQGTGRFCLCSSDKHTYAYTHTHTHTRTHARTHARTHLEQEQGG